MAAFEHPDREHERHMTALQEQMERELRLERLEEVTPAPRSWPPSALTVTSVMVSLAWTVLNGPDRDRRDAARVLAELVLEAGES